MTKTQIRSRIRKLLDQLGDIRAELEDIRDEVEETRDSIEPYDGAYELTSEQEERQEWLDELYYVLDNAVETLYSSEIDEMEEYL